jgi:hypothetical protein
MQTIPLPSSAQSQQPLTYTTEILPILDHVQNPATTVVTKVPPLAAIGTNTFVPLAPSSVYVINSQTLAAGGPAVTISNSVLSLGTNGS